MLRPSIALIGCGAVGGFYGAALARAGLPLTGMPCRRLAFLNARFRSPPPALR